MQPFKYVVHNVAQSYGRPQPSCRNLSLATMGRACTFTRPFGRDRSQRLPPCLFYIGGILRTQRR